MSLERAKDFPFFKKISAKRKETAQEPEATAQRQSHFHHTPEARPASVGAKPGQNEGIQDQAQAVLRVSENGGLRSGRYAHRPPSWPAW